MLDSHLSPHHANSDHETKTSSPEVSHLPLLSHPHLKIKILQISLLDCSFSTDVVSLGQGFSAKQIYVV